MNRVVKFLLAEEVQLDYIKTDADSDVAIRMRNGNFYWLTEEDKLAKKVKEAEEKEEQEKEKEETQKDKKDMTKEEKKAEKMKLKEEKRIKKEKEKIEKERKKQANKKKVKVVDSENINSLTETLVISSQEQQMPGIRGSLIRSIDGETTYKPVLENINVDIKKGAFVAILGE